MAKGTMALTTDGRITICTAPEEKRGMGRCNHVAHQNVGESEADFIDRVSSQMSSDGESSKPTEEEKIEENVITKEEISELKQQIFDIAGQEVTVDNLFEVLDSLPPEKQRQIIEIGFEKGQYFAFPITEDKFTQANLDNQIYFGNMGEFGIGAKKSHINEILEEVGETIEQHGSGYIRNNYKNGLTDEEWEQLQYSTRLASINKTVAISAPGAEARNLFYGLSDTMIIEDCYDDESTGILTCHMPGGFCEKCARKSGMGDVIDVLKKGSFKGQVETIRIGGLISTNLSEPLTQAYLDAIHSANDPKAGQHKVLVATFEGYKSSPIIQKALEGKTTLERRQLLSDGLKQAYSDQGVKIDPFNIEIVAKRMTSFKRTAKGLEYVEENEVCDLANVSSIGSRNNIFKKASLSSAYTKVSTPSTTNASELDSFADLLGLE